MKSVAQNRRARYDYDILDTYQAGVALNGPEVKSCRAGMVNLSGAYVSFLSGRPVLKNVTIAQYAFASGMAEYQPGRDRNLLLSKAEIAKLESAAAEKGVTILPLEVKAGRTIKIILGVARGQKKFDKRQKIKERDVETRLKRGEEY